MWHFKSFAVFNKVPPSRPSGASEKRLSVHCNSNRIEHFWENPVGCHWLKKNHVTELFPGIVKTSEARAKRGEKNNDKGCGGRWVNASAQPAAAWMSNIHRIKHIIVLLLLLFLSPVGSDNSGLDEQIFENPPNSCMPPYSLSLSGMPAAGWCSLWCVKLLKGQEDTPICPPSIRNSHTSADRLLLMEKAEDGLGQPFPLFIMCLVFTCKTNLAFKNSLYWK